MQLDRRGSETFRCIGVIRPPNYFSVIAAVITSAAFCLLLNSLPAVSFAQARVDLDDLAVKGEVLSAHRLRMSTREASRIQDRVKYRKDFRSEIIDGADVRVPASETLERAADETEQK